MQDQTAQMQDQTVSVRLSDSAIHVENYTGSDIADSFESLSTCSLMPGTQTQNAKHYT